MKNGIVLVALWAGLVGCEQSAQEDVAPAIAGVYTVSSLLNRNGEVLTFPQRSAQGQVVVTAEVNITQVDDYQISIVRRGIGYGNPYSESLGFYEIRRDGNQYVVYQDNRYAGSVDGKTAYFYLNGKSKNSMIVSLQAQR